MNGGTRSLATINGEKEPLKASERLVDPSLNTEANFPSVSFPPINDSLLERYSSFSVTDENSDFHTTEPMMVSPTHFASPEATFHLQ